MPRSPLVREDLLPCSDHEVEDRPKDARDPLLVSACLIGLRTRLDGRARLYPEVAALSARKP